MITIEQVSDVIGHTAYDRAHKKIGEVSQVFLDDETGQPEWMTVRTGLFGTKETFVPLEPAELRGDEVVVPFEQEDIKDAPRVDTEAGHLPPAEEAQLYEYYGMTYQPVTGTAPEAPGAGAPDVGAPPPASTTPRAETPPRRGETDEAMTRSEERLRVGKEQHEAGRARLRKYVVTDYEQRTVPVRREQVRVEREPITEENREQAMAGPEISEAEHEAVLHEERPVVGKETTPVERVRLEKEAVTEEETVGDEVRKERIQSEGVEQARAEEEERRFER
jgi:uncharacterized protein (TIGR02271 family)